MTRYFLAICALLLATSPACGGGGGGGSDGGTEVDVIADLTADLPDASDPLEHAVGDWRVRVDPDGCTWSVRPVDASTPLLAGPAGCQNWLSLATSGAPAVEQLFGAYQIDLDAIPMSSPNPAVKPLPVPFPGALEVRLELGNTKAVLRFEARSDGALRIALVAPGAITGALRFAVAPDESFFGLGTQSVAMDLRGRRFPLWTQEQGIGKPEGGGFFPLNNIPEAAYAPMGVWHSTAGYSAVLAIDAYTELDLANPTGSLRSHGELPAFALISGATPRERLKKVTDIIGRIDTPPAWMFAPWNDAVGGPEHLRAVAQTLRDHGVPSSAIWSEDWIGGTEGPSGYRLSYAWAWDPTQYPDLAADIAWLHARGFAFLAYFNPFVPTNVAMWDEGVAGGFLIKSPMGGPYIFADPAGRDASMVDLTNPAARTWLSGYLRTAAKTLAIDGWMADFAEWLPTDAIVSTGESAWLVHNRYPLLWQKVNRDVLTEVHSGGPSTDEGWLFFARSGWASTRGATAPLAPMLWGGDQDTDWDRDDGLPSVIPIATHVGLSGVPIFGSDIAGYSSFQATPTTKELFYRWDSMAALHPVMRTHHGSSECANWSFDRDPETLEHHRRWASVHSRLLPLFQALAKTAADTGLPLIRHPWLVEPSQPALWTGTPDLFFLGDDILVAPVVTEAATERSVTMPSAGWWPLFGRAPVPTTPSPDGTVTLLVPAAPTELPAFVRPGRVVPLTRHVVDSYYGATEAGITDRADTTGRTLALYPDAGGAVASYSIGDITLVAAGLGVDSDLRNATWEGIPLSPCTLVSPVPPCATEAGALVVPPGVLKSGAATVTLS
ncbi:MAG: glycoside hydrolase family 31 protein, partial [Myxococcota bacterium]